MNVGYAHSWIEINATDMWRPGIDASATAKRFGMLFAGAATHLGCGYYLNLAQGKTPPLE